MTSTKALPRKTSISVKQMYSLCLNSYYLIFTVQAVKYDLPRFHLTDSPPVCSPSLCLSFNVPATKIQVTRHEEAGVISHLHDTRRPVSHPTSKYTDILHLILRSNQNNISNRFQPASQVYYESSTDHLRLTGLGTFDSNLFKTLIYYEPTVPVAINIKQISDIKGEGWVKA